MSPALFNYCGRINRFALDELLNDFELASLTSLQKLSFSYWHHIIIILRSSMWIFNKYSNLFIVCKQNSQASPLNFWIEGCGQEVCMTVMIRTQHWDWGMSRHRSYRLRLWSMVKINKPGRKIITFMMLLLDPLYWIHKFWTRQLQIHPMLMYCREIDRYASSISKLHTERWPKPHSLVLYAIMAISKHYYSTKLDNHSQYCDSEHFFTENKGAERALRCTSSWLRGEA